MEEVMNLEAQPSHIPLLRKWLRILLYLQLAAVILAIPNLIPNIGSWVTWIGYGMNALLVYVLLRVSPACGRYRKSAVLKVIYLGTVILVMLMPSLGLIGSLLTLAGSVCGIIASYQEYHGHAEVVTALDEKLAGKWSGLFIWQLVVGILVGLATSAGVIVSMLSGGSISVELVAVIVSLPALVLQVVYLVYMKRTVRLLQ